MIGTCPELANWLSILKKFECDRHDSNHEGLSYIGRRVHFKGFFSGPNVRVPACLCEYLTIFMQHRNKN